MCETLLLSLKTDFKLIKFLFLLHQAHILADKNPSGTNIANHQADVIDWDNLQKVFSGEISIEDLGSKHTVDKPAKKKHRLGNVEVTKALSSIPTKPTTRILDKKKFVVAKDCDNNSSLVRVIKENGGDVRNRLSKNVGEYVCTFRYFILTLFSSHSIIV